MLESLGVIAICFIIAVVAVVVLYSAVMLQGYLAPIYKRMERGEPKSPLSYKPCCPPGLGCNERARSSPCRRLLAYKFADTSETMQLDMYWSQYNRAPSVERLSAWENYRDTLIEENLHKIPGGPQQKQLLGANETVEIAQGEAEPRQRSAERPTHTEYPGSFPHTDDHWPLRN